MTTLRKLIAVAVLLSGACNLDIGNPNSPEPIGQDPPRAEVAAAAFGILIAARSDHADWVLDGGIIGREAYRFDGSDPRFVTEFLQGPLDPGSGAFGGDHWFEEYRAIRSTNNLLNVIGTASQLTAAEQNAVRGFAETMQAWSFLMVLNAHTQDSIPVDVNQPLGSAPAPFVTRDSAFALVSNLLDSAQAHLTAAGSTAFPFSLPNGFSGFDDPAGFAQFNRALKARVEVYRASEGCAGCYATALTALGASFVDTTGAATLGNGVYFDFGTGPGDNANFLSQDPATSDNLAHPALTTDAETQSGGGLDARLLAKTFVLSSPRTVSGLTSNRTFTGYPTPSSPIPIIRNEELILLRAEANRPTNAAGAANDINYIRVNSGGLAAIANLGAQSADSILTVILKEKRYSLMYEGGHRWIDARRYGRLASIPIDRPATDIVHPSLPIPTDEVLPRP